MKEATGRYLLRSFDDAVFRDASRATEIRALYAAIDGEKSFITAARNEGNMRE